MSGIGIWAIEQCEHSYEKECRDLMVRQLIEHFHGLDEENNLEIELVFGLRLPGAEIDLLAFTSLGVFIGEMKLAYGKLRGEMNGHWFEVTEQGVRRRKGDENPYSQTRRYRSLVVSQIGKFTEKFGDAVFTGDKPHRACKSGLVQVPLLKLDTSIDDPWWFPSGVGEWLPRVIDYKGEKQIDIKGAQKWLARIGCLRLSLLQAATKLKLTLPNTLEGESKQESLVEGWKPLKPLDINQMRAVTMQPSLNSTILAGPGAGKTRVVANRANYLYQHLKDREWMGVVSYTNSAADEIGAQLELSSKQKERVYIGTFHSFAISLIKKSATGVIPNSILNEQTAIWRYSCICRISPQQASEQLRLIASTHIDDLPEDVQGSWSAFLKHLKGYKVATYESLLHELYRISIEEPGILPAYLVYDEFQDISPMQGEVIRQLSNAGTKVTVVGDPEQSIFGFNGCSPQSLISFCESCATEAVIKLDTNYRSHRSIVELSNNLRQTPEIDLVIKPKGDIGVGGWTSKIFESSKSQAKAVSDWVKAKHENENIPLNEIAILYRESKSAKVLISELTAQNIPFKSNTVEFIYPRPMREIASLVGFNVNSSNPEKLMSFMEVFPQISPGLSQCFIEEGGANTPVTFETLKTFISALPKRYQDEVTVLENTINKVFKKNHESNLEEIDWLWNEIVEPNLSIEERRNKEHILELLGLWREYLKLDPEGGLDTLKVGAMDVEESGSEVVSLSSIHSAKGKEWQAVAVIDICDDAFIKASRDYSEEIRLLHVACSRACNWLLLGFPNRRGFTVDKGVIRSEFERFT